MEGNTKPTDRGLYHTIRWTSEPTNGGSHLQMEGACKCVPLTYRLPVKRSPNTTRCPAHTCLLPWLHTCLLRAGLALGLAPDLCTNNPTNSTMACRDAKMAPTQWYEAQPCTRGLWLSGCNGHAHACVASRKVAMHRRTCREPRRSHRAPGSIKVGPPSLLHVLPIYSTLWLAPRKHRDHYTPAPDEPRPAPPARPHLPAAARSLSTPPCVQSVQRLGGLAWQTEVGHELRLEH